MEHNIECTVEQSNHPVKTEWQWNEKLCYSVTYVYYIYRNMCLIKDMHFTCKQYFLYLYHHYTVQVAWVQLEYLCHWLELRKTPPAQVAEGQGDRVPASFGASWSGMQQEPATCIWALTSCMFLLHPATTCADGCWCPVPLTFSNLCWWCFPSSQWRKYSNCTCVTCTVWWFLYVMVVCDGGVWWR